MLGLDLTVWRINRIGTCGEGNEECTFDLVVNAVVEGVDFAWGWQEPAVLHTKFHGVVSGVRDGMRQQTEPGLLRRNPKPGDVRGMRAKVFEGGRTL
jgi:hypothetical protein